MGVRYFSGVFPRQRAAQCVEGLAQHAWLLVHRTAQGQRNRVVPGELVAAHAADWMRLVIEFGQPRTDHPEARNVIRH
jgi:hypothetical protein